MQLQEPFAYIDPAAMRWDVPSGATVDGASIPRALWTLIGGPFEGKYRDASVVHDWFCDIRTQPWRAVHRMFYNAMLTSGVSEARAKMLYAGVMLGGPKWSENTVSNSQLAAVRSAVTGKKPESGKLQDVRASAQLEILTTRTGVLGGSRRSAARSLSSVNALSGELGVSVSQAARVLRKESGGPKGKIAMGFSPSDRKMERVTNAATGLSLDEIDEMVARESKDLKLRPLTPRRKR